MRWISQLFHLKIETSFLDQGHVYFYKESTLIPAKSANCFMKFSYGGIHKPCGHGRGRGVSQMSMLLHKPYFVKWSTRGVKNLQKTVHMIYGCPLIRIAKIDDFTPNVVKIKISRHLWKLPRKSNNNLKRRWFFEDIPIYMRMYYVVNLSKIHKYSPSI